MNPECVAIGECGLDYNRDFSPVDIQKEVFEKQVWIVLYSLSKEVLFIVWCKLCIFVVYYTMHDMFQIVSFIVLGLHEA